MFFGGLWGCGCVLFLFFVVFLVFGVGFCVMVVACCCLFCWGFVVDWKSAAVERGRLNELAKLDIAIRDAYAHLDDLWFEWERVALSLRGGV